MNTTNKKNPVGVLKGEMLKVLNSLQSGCCVNAAIDRDENTLLHNVSTSEVAEVLLQHGADVNALNADGETSLHSAISRRREVSLVHLLLKYGANVNIRNNYGQTPLHLAITDSDGLLVVRELLKHGANVNVTDNKGNTVLFLVVKYYKNLEIIKELLEFDADMNIRSSSLSRFCTPIDEAVNGGDQKCAKLFIEITIIRNYHNNYRKIKDLESYIKASNNRQLSCFFYECVNEIVRMQTEKINTNYTLYDFVVKTNRVIKPLYSNNRNRIRRILSKYEIYHDIILAGIQPCLQRADLLDKLMDFQVTSDIKHVLGNTFLLNGDCLFKIGEYLSNDDLLNFLMVIDKSVNQATFSLDKYLT